MATRIFSRHVHRPTPVTGSSSGGTNSSAANAISTGNSTQNTSSLNPVSSNISTKPAAAVGPVLSLWIAVLMTCLFVTGCTTSAQRFAFAVRDADTALPVPDAHATITLSQKPFWFEGQPVYLTTDNVGMDHALLVLNQATYKVQIARKGYQDVCFDLPAFNNNFPFGHWLASVRCKHASNEPCTSECQVSRLELMVTEPMPQ